MPLAIVIGSVFWTVFIIVVGNAFGGLFAAGAAIILSLACLFWFVAFSGENPRTLIFGDK